MPRFELRDAFGMCYQLATRDWETAARWLAEWLPRLTIPGIPGEDMARLRPMIVVTPLEGADRRPDWPADSRYIYEPFYVSGPAEMALKTIYARRREVERLIAGHPYRGAPDGH